MAEATVKTIQVVDHRIEPQPDPVYQYTIGPTQNQYYTINASSKSESTVTFNNLTTLGVDRAYLDTMELEITARIVFTSNKDIGDTTDAEDPDYGDGPQKYIPIPLPGEWTFDSFPFAKCCEDVRVNINGGSFFSQPLSYVRAKEHYMNQRALSECYENVCPVHKPLGQYESGRGYDRAVSAEEMQTLVDPKNGCGTVNIPLSRLGSLKAGNPYLQSEQGITGGYNNQIIDLGKDLSPTGEEFKFIGKYAVDEEGSASKAGLNFTNYHVNQQNPAETIVVARWREPIFCPPFSSRYDATYGRPLYNITSMDLQFNLQDLGNMIRVANLTGQQQLFSTDALNKKHRCVTGYTITLEDVKLCYQVMTIPQTIQKPLTTLVPYRRFVPYVTNFTSDHPEYGQGVASDVTVAGGRVRLNSGVYTLNEIPTAIWLFAAPAKSVLQRNQPDIYARTGQQIAANNDVPDLLKGANMCNVGNWDSNKQFGFLNQINLSLANTTQILYTAKVHDLYRIAKANGCQDSFLSWGCPNSVAEGYLTEVVDSMTPYEGDDNYAGARFNFKHVPGCGSVLRLIPGVDLIVPDQALIPGANANNMVFQVQEAVVDIPPHSAAQNSYSLWLLFEYVGVAAISPGTCEVSMNPLGSGEIMAASPVISSTTEASEGELGDDTMGRGGSWYAALARTLRDTGIISKLLKIFPKTENIGKEVAEAGFGEPAMKRGRGGAVIGHGVNDWV